MRAIKGFPCLMQLVGFRLWDDNPDRKRIGAESALRAIPLARSDYRESVLEATYRELSDGDLSFLEAMLPDEGVSSMADIAARLGKSTSYARVYRKRLLEQGVIAEERRGYVSFDLPYLREFLKEGLEQ